MDDVKAQLANRLKEANNVLVSITSNPSVDQFAAAIGLTLILNKLGKHATTVFSGTIPSTIEFLQPEKVVEKNTDSLRDFIISLDKAKADKLRYKIEDNFVKIFITPYHASISDKDLVFSQGDFNVDVVVGLGVHQREELDQAITAHGRILHDATVTTINTQPPSKLGSINWSDSKSSSLCEMLVVLSDLLAKQGLFDTQISNALLTGIVAETQRFSNQKTTSQTMSASSKLLATGANQQLVATQLTPKPAPPPKPPKPALPKPAVPKSSQATPKKPEDGVLEINHGQPIPEDNGGEEGSDVTQVVIDEQGTLQTVDEAAKAQAEDPYQENIDDNKDDKNDQDPSASEQPPSDQSAELPTPPENPPTNPDPSAILPPVSNYVPPPLIKIPPDPEVEQSSDQQAPPTVPTSQPEPPAPPSTQQNNVSDEGNNTFLNGPRIVLEPPTMGGQLNSTDEGGPAPDGFTDPLSSDSEEQPSGAAIPTPMLNHDTGPAETASMNRAPLTIEPPTLSAPPQQGDGTLPNLSEVRNAVDAALSNTEPTVSNQPLDSLNAQPVNLDLAQAPVQATQPLTQPPYTPPPQFSPPQVDPNGLETGSSIPTNVIQPNVAPAPPDAQNAPPVPPPIIPLNDNNLPPSFTAL